MVHILIKRIICKYIALTINYVKTLLADKYLTTTLILTLITSLLYSYILIWKHNLFYTYAWDLGIYAQALKSTLNGRVMYHTPNLLINPSGNHMEIHFTPILFILLPLYALAPRAETLLVIKSFASFTSSIPLYLLSKKTMNSAKKALVVVLLYFLYPPLHGALWFDFQPQSFLPLLVFSAECAYIYKKKILWILFLVLTAMVTEHGALIALLLVLIKLIDYLKDLRYRKILFSRRELLHKIILLSILLLYFVSIASYLNYCQTVNTTTEFRDYLKAYENWRVLGYRGNTFLLPLYIATHPDKALEALLYDYHFKFINILLTYGVFLFIPLQSIYGIFSLAIQVPFLFSNYRAYYTIGSHYAYYYMFFIFLGLIRTLSREHFRKHFETYTRGLIITTVIALVCAHPLSPLAEHLVREYGVFWFPILNTQPYRIESLRKLVDLANRLNKPILVQNHVFPHTTLESHVYAIPIESMYDFNETATIKYIDTLLDRVELVLLDTSIEFFDRVSREVFIKSIEKGFNIYAKSGLSILLAKNYSGEVLELENGYST